MKDNDKQLSQPPDKARPTQGYKPLTGPCVVIKTKSFKVRFGHYKDDKAAQKVANSIANRREDKATVRATRWERSHGR